MNSFLIIRPCLASHGESLFSEPRRCALPIWLGLFLWAAPLWLHMMGRDKRNYISLVEQGWNLFKGSPCWDFRRLTPHALSLEPDVCYFLLSDFILFWLKHHNFSLWILKMKLCKFVLLVNRFLAFLGHTNRNIYNLGPGLCSVSHWESWWADSLLHACREQEEWVNDYTVDIALAGAYKVVTVDFENVWKTWADHESMCGIRVAGCLHR